MKILRIENIFSIPRVARELDFYSNWEFVSKFYVELWIIKLFPDTQLLL